MTRTRGNLVPKGLVLGQESSELVYGLQLEGMVFLRAELSDRQYDEFVAFFRVLKAL